MAGSERDDDEDVLDPSEQLNRPQDTAFNQQRIPAWSPILDPVWVIVALFYLGVIMVPVGYKIDSIQSEVVEMKEIYDGLEIDHRCGIGQNFNANHTCTLNFTVPENLNPPILIHYELTNFYQNHRSYYQSRDNYQLRGLTASGTAASATKLACDPLHTLGDVLLYPCGVAANTMFNDVITLVKGEDIYGEELVMIEEGIAWSSDLEYNFQQKEDFRMELCGGDGTNPEGCCDGDDWSCETPALNKKDGLYYRYFYPNEETTQYLYETYPDIVSPLEGVENEHFVVWMRIAAHGTFRKLYGWINQPIAKGTVLEFEVRNNYVVERFRGTKGLIVGNTSIFGGRNVYLADMFLGVGYFCLVMGVLFSLKHTFRPRKLADSKYLHFKED